MVDTYDDVGVGAAHHGSIKEAPSSRQAPTVLSEFASMSLLGDDRPLVPLSGTPAIRVDFSENSHPDVPKVPDFQRQ
jgi:hypothetical protein